jgi:hypothetical protein
VGLLGGMALYPPGQEHEASDQPEDSKMPKAAAEHEEWQGVAVGAIANTVWIVV